MVCGVAGILAPAPQLAVAEEGSQAGGPVVVEATDQDLAAFDEVWQTIRDSHWDPELGGVDWDAAKAELRPKAVAAKTRAEVRQIMRQMIGRLEQSHFGVIPSEAYSVVEEGSDDDAVEEPEEKGRKRGGQAGIHIRLRDGQLMVVRVDSHSGAAEVGVQPGWTIRRIAKRTQDEILKAAKEATEHGPTRLNTIVGMMGERRTRGAPGKELEIEFRDFDEQTHSLRIPILPSGGEEIQFANLPPMRVSFQKRILSQDIVYFSFNLFLDPVRIMPAFREAVRDARSGRGLIIDLRGNYGGIGAMTFGMASEFARKQGALGVMRMRGQELKFPVFPQLDPYTGSVAVLVDECSASSAEVLAGGLKDLRLARIFGSRTAGLALPSKIKRLSNGDALQCAIANYTSASGKSLEGVGVTPDEVVAETQDAFRSTADPVLQTAIEWILSQHRN